MFGHRRTELNEMITNWKKSPNLRPGSVRSPSLKEEELDPVRIKLYYINILNFINKRNC